MLDIDNTEDLRVRTLGGNDTFDGADVAGTELQSIAADLTGSTGSSDAAADQVTVNGTAADDQLSVDDDGLSVVASGVTATVRVIGADPTLDTLTVAGLDGSDGITVSPGAYALMLLQLLP